MFLTALPEKNSAVNEAPYILCQIIGPTIGNLIRNGRAHALAEAREAIEKYPMGKTLIVSGDYLPVAQLKINASGNTLHANYVKSTGQVRVAAAQKVQN